MDILPYLQSLAQRIDLVVLRARRRRRRCRGDGVALLHYTRLNSNPTQ